VENPKNLNFEELEAAQLPRVLPDVAAAVINTNYALEADLNPLEDALIMEGSDSPYVNVVAVRKGDQDSEKIQILKEVIQSEKVKEFILEKYEGAVVPAF
jgi:D-methionine transport system substrate-binding protein